MPSVEISAPASTKAITNAAEVQVLWSANRRPCSGSGTVWASSRRSWTSASPLPKPPSANVTTSSQKWGATAHSTRSAAMHMRPAM